MTVVDEDRVYVLIVEDDQDNADLLARTLRADARLWIAKTVEEARKTLESSLVHVVVADHRLPDGTGASLLRFVAEKYPKVGRMLVTAYGDSEEVVAACKEGAVERFFLKPYSPQQLRSGVLALLRRCGAVNLPRVLVADDDADIRKIVSAFLRSKFIEVHEVSDGLAAVESLQKERFDAALVDVSMPKLDGLGVLKRALATDPDLPLVYLTGADLSVGLTLLQLGAFDLVAKPVRKDELIMRVERAIIVRRERKEHKRLLTEVRAGRQSDDMVVESDAMKAVLDQTRMVAKHDVNVLIQGDTGTGKEVVARLLHRESRRCEGPFLPVNCGAIPDTLIESELFGHERGAFTDAKTAKIGFFEAADGGTLFLDEVGELSLQAQVRLLRVLETKEVQRVGSTKATRVDARVLAATHQNLEDLVKAGRFRQDLYYRLNGFTIRILPLKERPADIGPLIRMAAQGFCVRNGLPMPEISAAALEQAKSYEWPGNVRELLHVTERTLIARGPTRIDRLELDDKQQLTPTRTADIDPSLPLREAIGPMIDDLEKRYLLAALQHCDGHLGKTAEHAGIHRKSLYNKLKQHGISVKDSPDE